MRRPKSLPEAASLFEIVAVTLLLGLPGVTVKVTPLVGPPDVSGTATVLQASVMPKSLLCCTLSTAEPRLAALRQVKFMVRLPLLCVTVGRVTVDVGLEAPSNQAKPFFTPSPLASASKAAPPDQASY